MNDELKVQQATECLMSFFKEMHSLGRDALRPHRSIDWNEAVDEDAIQSVRAEQRKRLEDIFSRHCAQGLHAERLKDEHMALQDPPAHDPDHETISNISFCGESILIETAEDIEVNAHYLYELVSVGGKYLIKDNKKYRLPTNVKWKADLL